MSNTLGWRVLSVASLIEDRILEIGDGYRAKNSEMGDRGLPFLRIANVGNVGFDLAKADLLDEANLHKVGNKISQVGDVVFTTKGSVGRFAYVKPETPRFVYSPQVSYWRILEKDVLDSRFLLYWLQGPEFAKQVYQVKGLTDMADYVNLRDQRNMTIRAPSLPFQRKIADILSAYDDLIENNTRRIKILEEMAQMIYREWFVHLRFPGHEQVEMVETEFGLIPDDWRVVKLGEVSTLRRGRSYRSQDLVSLGGLPFLNLKCIARGGGFRHDGIKRYGGDFKDSQTARPGDVVVAVTDMTQERRLVAHAARVPLMDHSFAVMSMDLVCVEPHEEITAGYLHGLLRFSDFSDTIKQHANGVNVLHLNPQQIHEFSFVLPSKTFRDKYGLFSDDLYRQCDVLQRKNSNLRQTRDLLLPKLVSGEVKVDQERLV